MFGVVVSIDGREIQGQVGRFTFMGRLRIRWRRLRGRPALCALEL